MSSDLVSAMSSAASGLRAQTVRIRISAENIANADSTAQAPGEDPYRRKMPIFQSYVDRQTGAGQVRVVDAHEDQTPFPEKFDPAHPAADARGYVLMSNVSALVEMADLREAQRAYEANLNVVEASRAMMMGVVQILKT